MLRVALTEKKAGASFVKKEYHFTESLDGDHTFGNGRAYLVGALCCLYSCGKCDDRRSSGPVLYPADIACIYDVLYK